MKITHLLLLLTIVLISPAMSHAASQDAAAKKCESIHQTPIAVFVEPTDKEIEALKKEDEEGFYIIANDAMYYQYQATEFLDKMKFPYCFTENEKHVFKAADNKEYIVNKKCRPGACFSGMGAKSLFQHTLSIFPCRNPI